MWRQQRHGWDLWAQLISLQPAVRSVISKLLTHKRSTCGEAAAARHCTRISGTTFTMMRRRSQAQLFFLSSAFLPVKEVSAVFLENVVTHCWIICGHREREPRCGDMIMFWKLWLGMCRMSYLSTLISQLKTTVTAEWVFGVPFFFTAPLSVSTERKGCWRVTPALTKKHSPCRERRC